MRLFSKFVPGFLTDLFAKKYPRRDDSKPNESYVIAFDKTDSAPAFAVRLEFMKAQYPDLKASVHIANAHNMPRQHVVSIADYIIKQISESVWERTADKPTGTITTLSNGAIVSYSLKEEIRPGTFKEMAEALEARLIKIQGDIDLNYIKPDVAGRGVQADDYGPMDPKSP